MYKLKTVDYYEKKNKITNISAFSMSTMQSKLSEVIPDITLLSLIVSFDNSIFTGSTIALIWKLNSYF